MIIDSQSCGSKDALEQGSLSVFFRVRGGNSRFSVVGDRVNNAYDVVLVLRNAVESLQDDCSCHVRSAVTVCILIERIAEAGRIDRCCTTNEPNLESGSLCTILIDSKAKKSRRNESNSLSVMDKAMFALTYINLLVELCCSFVSMYKFSIRIHPVANLGFIESPKLLPYRFDPSSG